MESAICTNCQLWCYNVTNEHTYSLPNCTQAISQKSFLLFAFSFFYFLSFLLFLLVSQLISLLWVIDSEMRASKFKDFFKQTFNSPNNFKCVACAPPYKFVLTGLLLSTLYIRSYTYGLFEKNYYILPVCILVISFWSVIIHNSVY